VKRLWLNLAAVLGVALVSTGSVALADHGRPGKGERGDRARVAAATRVFTLTPSTHGNPEGIAAARRGVFFVGTVALPGNGGDGTIYRGTVDNPTVTVFIPGGPGKSATGMKVAGGKLYVAGAATGKITVYDIATKNVVATFDTGSGGFLNDLVVTRRGDVFVTDSIRPTLWHLTAAQVAAGSGTPEAISVAPEITYQTGFNLNGIVAKNGGRRLIVVQSNTGKLFRIDVTATGRTIRAIDAPALVGGDGMLLDRGRLIVVQGGASPKLNFVKLRSGASRGEIVATRTDPTLKGSSTVARSGKLLLVVNANFGGSPPFTVSGLPRNAGDDDD
jgi:Cu-Zn family superoxide dismutase